MTSRRDILKSLGLSFLGAAGPVPAANALTPTTDAAGQTAVPRFGLNLHLDRFPEEQAFAQLAMAKASGIQQIRGLALNPSQIMPVPETWSFIHPDRDLTLLKEFGFEAIACLGYGVARASAQAPDHGRKPSAEAFFPPDDWAIWEAYVARCVSRYKGRVTAWSPWNEPDNFHFFLPSPQSQGRDLPSLVARRQKFLELQRRTYDVVKRVDPGAQVLSGAFSMGGDYDPGFFPWLCDNGLLDCCDAIDLHSYWGVGFLERTVGLARATLDRAGARKPIWLTEFGAAFRDDPAWIGPFGLDQIASLAVKALATAQALGLERLFWYQGFTEWTEPAGLAAPGYSMTITDGPTPAYWSFSAAARLLQDAVYDGPADLTGGPAKGYRFRKGSSEVLVLWALSPELLDNRPASANCRLSWRGRDLSLALSDRPTVLCSG